jgi:hypothetical protein
MSVKMPGVYVTERHVESLLGPDLPYPVEAHVYTAEEFEAMVGRPPQGDDLERVNCPHAGASGHLMDGVCLVHETPRFVCGCMAPCGTSRDEFPAIRVSDGPEWNPSRIVVEMEHILGWPGLDAFPALEARLRGHYYEAITPGLLEHMRQEVIQAFYELRQRGALFRDVMREGAWRYDGRGR